MTKPKVIVGLSGGVDSAVAAYLLKKDGYDVIGVTLRTWHGDDGEESRCCEIDDARETARIIGIPYYVFNCTSDFDRKVIRPFICDYVNGMTPNPCVICNREIKWEKLLYYADLFEADHVATGHYASVVLLDNGRYTVKKADHAEKDQTYMLYRLTQKQLSKTIMPLYGYSKKEVREIAEKIGLSVANKPDSQEICFVTGGDYADFIENHTDRIPAEGNFVDEQGRILGKHKGIIHYTVGQRKGLGIALGKPAYIKKIDSEKNEIVLSTSADTGCSGIICKSLNFTGIETPAVSDKLRCHVKVRYRHPGQTATLEMTDTDTLRAVFDGPVRLAAPGQSAVFYDENDCLLGGGIICEVI